MGFSSGSFANPISSTKRDPNERDPIKQRVGARRLDRHRLLLLAWWLFLELATVDRRRNTVKQTRCQGDQISKMRLGLALCSRENKLKLVRPPVRLI